MRIYGHGDDPRTGPLHTISPGNVWVPESVGTWGRGTWLVSYGEANMADVWTRHPVNGFDWTETVRVL